MSRLFDSLCFDQGAVFTTVTVTVTVVWGGTLD